MSKPTVFIASVIDIRNEPGWAGGFTRAHVEGALANGTRILKQGYEKGDANPDGTPGVILGSIEYEGQIGYFVEWALSPRVAVFIAGHRVREAP